MYSSMYSSFALKFSILGFCSRDSALPPCCLKNWSLNAVILRSMSLMLITQRKKSCGVFKLWQALYNFTEKQRKQTTSLCISVVREAFQYSPSYLLPDLYKLEQCSFICLVLLAIIKVTCYFLLQMSALWIDIAHAGCPLQGTFKKMAWLETV